MFPLILFAVLLLKFTVEVCGLNVPLFTQFPDRLIVPEFAKKLAPEEFVKLLPTTKSPAPLLKVPEFVKSDLMWVIPVLAVKVALFVKLPFTLKPPVPAVKLPDVLLRLPETLIPPVLPVTIALLLKSPATSKLSLPMVNVAPLVLTSLPLTVTFPVPMPELNIAPDPLLVKFRPTARLPLPTLKVPLLVKSAVLFTSEMLRFAALFTDPALTVKLPFKIRSTFARVFVPTPVKER